MTLSFAENGPPERSFSRTLYVSVSVKARY
jgi:hypothetical protein